MSGSYLQRRKMEKRGQKELLSTQESPKLQEIFTTVAIVCHRYERLAACQIFSPLFCFEQEKKLKTELFEETVYK